ncbi:hypothetical protein QR98_0084320 [Sarcoptes scabiei]|uniref:Uncharacterized protein n=1 Tax=Sarcoptes scabiei TaxID=52283 RepID=A0A132AFX0_SARSC|nr:hypothetical protein QR98_0084320 [Sarcoptes scabiei]
MVAHQTRSCSRTT